MKQIRRLILLLVLMMVFALVGSVQAQDETGTPTPEGTEIVIVVEATETPTIEATPVETPIIVVVPDTSGNLTGRDLSQSALVGAVVIVLGIVAYRLTTMVGRSYPPGTSTSLERAREKAQEFTQASPSVLDDLAFFLADPLVQNAIKAVKEREQAATPPDGAALG